MTKALPIRTYIDQVLSAFSDPHCKRVELTPDQDKRRFGKRFRDAMRARGEYWRLAWEGTKLHVVRLELERYD